MYDFIYTFFKSFIDHVQAQLNEFLFISDSAFSYYWLLTFLIVYLVYIGLGKLNLKEGINFLLRPNSKAEFKKDIFFWSLRFLYKPIIYGYFLLNFNTLEKTIFRAFSSLGIGFSQPIIPLDSVLGSIFIGVLIFMFRDFAAYIFHLLQHKVKWFWYFHMTHHMATVLNPLTKYRIHPVEYLQVIFIPFFFEIPMALFFFKMFKVHGVDHSLLVILGLNYLIYYSLIHFRHSHIKIHYGFLSPIIISPVMHQVHHSRSRKHYDKNLSVIFSLWDSLFNTIYIPTKDENFDFGVKGYGGFIQNKSYWYEIKFPFILIGRDIHRFVKKMKLKKIGSRSPIARGSQHSLGFTLTELMITVMLFSFIALVGSGVLVNVATLKNNQIKIDSTETDLDLLITTMLKITSVGVNVRYFNGTLNGASSPPTGEGFVRSYVYKDDASMGVRPSDTLMFFARETSRSNLNPENTVSRFRPTGVFFIRKNESLNPNVRRGSQIIIDLGGAGAAVSPNGSNTITINNVSDVVLDQPQYSAGMVLQSIRMTVTMIYPITSTKVGLDCLGPTGDIATGIICNSTTNNKPFKTLEKSFTLTFPNNKRDAQVQGAEFEDGIYVFPAAQ